MQPWSYDELRLIRDMARRKQEPDTMARATGHTMAEVDVARWHLLGRSLEQACDALNIPILSQGAGGVSSPVRLGR